MNEDRPAALESAWRLIESRHPTLPTAVIADRVEMATIQTPLMVGADGSGARHLLIPIDEDAEVPESASGRWVRLTKRRLETGTESQVFADLMCSRSDLFDQFAVLSSDVVEAVAMDPSHSLRAISRVLTQWRELLQSGPDEGMDREAVIGLFAELLVLERLLNLDGDRGLQSWTGPTRGRHDFEQGQISLEVKATTARRGRPVVVHGLDQLEAAPGTDLFLWWTKLEVGVGRGESLQDVVTRLGSLVADTSSLDALLHRCGYGVDPNQDHSRPLFTVLESRVYRVDSSFPRIMSSSFIGGDVPRGVTSVTYTIDLSGDTPRSMSEDEIQMMLRNMATG